MDTGADTTGGETTTLTSHPTRKSSRSLRRKKLFKELLEKRLIYKQVIITPCLDGAFITLYSKNKAGALKVLNGANARAEGLTMFWGVPFRFIRD